MSPVAQPWRHGWGSHAVRPSPGVVPQWLKRFQCPLRHLAGASELGGGDAERYERGIRFRQTD